MDGSADFSFSETTLFLSVPFSLFLVSTCNLWDLTEIVFCSFSHPLCQHSLVGQVNLISEGAQSRPTQGLRPTLGKGQDFVRGTHRLCTQPPPSCWRRAGRSALLIPEERWLPPPVLRVSLHMVRAMGQKGSLWLYRRQDEENQRQGPKNATAGDKRLLHINNQSSQKHWVGARGWKRDEIFWP